MSGELAAKNAAPARTRYAAREGDPATVGSGPPAGSAGGTASKVEASVDRDLQLSLIDRIMAHRAAGDTTDMAPEMYPNPIDTYVDQERYDSEVERIFRGRPLLA